jgi:hypothetical protein
VGLHGEIKPVYGGESESFLLRDQGFV